MSGVSLQDDERGFHFALFAAVRNGLGARVRFLWVTDLNRVDVVLAISATALAAAAALITPVAPDSPVGPRALAIVIGVDTLVFLLSSSSAVALSVGAGSLVSALQNWLLRRDVAREAAAS